MTFLFLIYSDRYIHVESIRDHDQVLLEKSDFLIQLDHLYVDGDMARPAICYGDPAYSEAGHLKRKHKGAARSKYQKHVDASMQVARGAVEDGFKEHASLFSLMDYRKKSKLIVSPIKDQLIAQAFFLNIRTCYVGSQVNSTFAPDPPCAEDYLRNHNADLIP